MGLLAYDPVRVLQLRVRTARTLDALAAVRSADPAAAGAVAIARAVGAGLQESMLPLVDRIISSDALLSWLTALGGLSWPSSTMAAQLSAAHRLADLAREVLANPDAAELDALRTGLNNAASDVLALAAFFVDLGGRATAELLVRLGEGSADEDEQLALAASIRTAFGRATFHPSFDPRFASDLVDGFIERTNDHRANPAAAMTFLFSAVGIGTRVLVEVIGRVVAREQQDRDGASHGLLWPTMPPGSVFNRSFDDGDRHSAPGWVRSEDPMYALLEALARDGAAGRAVFTDGALAGYLLGERRYDHDGLRAVSAAASAAAAGPDVTRGAPDRVLVDGAAVASAYVNHVGTRPHLFDVPLHPAVAASTALILGTHLFAVHESVLRPVSMDRPAGGTVRLRDRSRPGVERVGALFDSRALAAATDLAVRHPDGVATLRAALDLYQTEEAAATADAVARGGVDERSALVEDAMVDAARLEAHFIQHAGHQAEAIGRSKDDVISFWIDVASFSVDVGRAELSGGAANVAAPVIGASLKPAASVAKELFANHEATAERDAEANATAAADQLVYTWYRELYAAGVVRPSLPAAAVDGEQMVTWAEFGELSASDQAMVRNAIEEDAALTIDAGALRDAIKVEQLPIYQDLE